MTNDEIDKVKVSLDDLIEVQCSDGNWNYSPYMCGIANGLILARAIIEDKEPIYLDPPKEYLCDKELNNDKQ